MILDFVKGFLTLFLLVKILLYFVPKNVFEKYIAFFAGVILVIGLLHPLLRGLLREEAVLDELQYEQWEVELLGIKEEAEALEKSGEQVMTDYYSRLSGEISEIENVIIETVKIENSIQAGSGNE